VPAARLDCAAYANRERIVSRRRKRHSPPARESRRAPRARPRPWWLLPLVGLLVVSVFLLRVWPRRRPVEATRSPAERLNAEEAYKTAITLGRDGHHLEALPFFESAVRQAPGSWTAHQSYASALYNSALETRLHLGKAEPITRSSVERITLVRSSMVQSGAADSMTAGARDRAFIAFQRGQMFVTFGLVDNAVDEFRRAIVMDPTNQSGIKAIHSLERLLATGGQGE
jgi:tetratricopeptide (TPR) repeat protein